MLGFVSAGRKIGFVGDERRRIYFRDDCLIYASSITKSTIKAAREKRQQLADWH